MFFSKTILTGQIIKTKSQGYGFINAHFDLKDVPISFTFAANHFKNSKRFK